MISDAKKNWWKDVVVYQIYPRSFMDSNGDGVGDLQGITTKLDYLKNLGIDVIWICPFYKSPQDDNGYDISDYQDIHAEYGQMRDFDALLIEAHKRGIRVIIDLVISHTSDEHPWFIESRSSKENSKRDWYIWKDAKVNKVPTNWESIFGGSVWNWDELTKQYFMHIFSARQPDLNWENLEMRRSIYKMICWWLDKGIDGFRIDAISHLKKDSTFTDMPNPENLEFVGAEPKHRNVEGVQEYLEDLCKNTFQKYDIMTVGEANGVSTADAEEWVGETKKKFNMIIQFEVIGLWDKDPTTRFKIRQVKEVLSRWQTELENRGWNALFLENHDIPRIVSKWGDVENYWRESATCMASMYFLMQGTPFIYQGQEIGMTNTKFETVDDFNDVAARNLFANRRKQGISDAATVVELQDTSRDNARTPMQWSALANAGFTTGKPWLKVNPNYLDINVQQQLEQPDSILNFYRQMIQLRKECAVFVDGSYGLILPDHPQIYAYTRTNEMQKMVIMCNMSPEAATFTEKLVLTYKNLKLANYKVSAHGHFTNLVLQPYETRVYLV